MSEKTNISWADLTASPWFGCSKVSQGCANCYAEKLTIQKGWAGWGDGSPRVKSKGFWNNARLWNRKAEGMSRRPRVFTSLIDWLDPMVPIEWLAEFLQVVHDCPNLDWLLLTKRPENFRSRLETVYTLASTPLSTRLFAHHWLCDCTPKNVWFGVTCEDQKTADLRLPILSQIPARVRWVSAEPLLETVHLRSFVDWAVIGGESGPGRRDCGILSIAQTVESCRQLGVPTYVKQDCAARSGQQGRIPADFWALKQGPKGIALW